MPVNTLSDLLKDQLQDLYSAEKQLLDELPKLAKSAHDSRLKATFNNRAVETRAQVDRLERIARNLDFNPSGRTCAAMKGLVTEENSAIDENAPAAIHDANLIAAAQRAEHYEMAGYGTAREFADVLGHGEIASLLEESLEEAKAADQKLTEVCRELLDSAPLDECEHENVPDAVKRDENRDPITGEHGAHPVGTGIGAATGGIAAGAAVGAAIGSSVGPAGTLAGAGAGAIAGAVGGGLAGKALAERVNPTVEHDYWRAQFRSRRYVTPTDTYETFGPAYQYGWESATTYSGRQFADIEGELEKGWGKARGSSKLTWDRAKNAVRDAWDRVTKAKAKSR
jgi:ferritin-like metal-binding protein YciE